MVPYYYFCYDFRTFKNSIMVRNLEFIVAFEITIVIS